MDNEYSWDYPCGLELCFGDFNCKSCKYNKNNSNSETNDTPDLISCPDDPVNHPSHYTYGDVETIDQMVAIFGPEFVAIYCRITAFKYLSRYKHKGNPVQDLEKARWYADNAFSLSWPFEKYADIPDISYATRYPDLNYAEWYVEQAKFDMVRYQCTSEKSYAARLITDINKALDCLVGEDHKSEA